MSAPEAPEVSEWAIAYYGWCGTPEVEASMGCFQCVSDGLHWAFHDAGEPCSETLHNWERGERFSAPDHV